LTGGAAGIVKAVNDNKAVQHQLEELKRHNCVMEGYGIYLAPYKRGREVPKKKKSKKLKMPKSVTADV